MNSSPIDLLRFKRPLEMPAIRLPVGPAFRFEFRSHQAEGHVFDFIR
jgi:hypothetical protein